MENKLTLGSLFDGSGGFPLGALMNGIEPVWSSEIEPFPIRVTTKRLPQVRHYGDISKLKGNELEKVDIITFGSPCQDMSLAGKRTGLNGSRSCLFFEAVRIVREMREATDGRYPRFIVWENVFGAFSSNRGEDFRAVLDTIVKIQNPQAPQVPMPEDGKWPYADILMGEGWSIAYRTFDAQYWGVPQRRRRIYLVADFGGSCAGKILFEQQGMPGNTAEGCQPWQGTADSAEDGIGTAGGIGLDGYNHRLTGNLEAALGANCGMATGRNGVLCPDDGSSTFDVRFTSEGTRNYRGHCYATNISRALDTGGQNPDSNHGGVICLNDQGGQRMDVVENMTGTLRAQANHPPLVFENHSQDGRYRGPLEVSQPVMSLYGTGGNNQPFVVEPPGDIRAYGISSYDSHAMKSANPKAGIYEADTARTLDNNGGNPACNQGGMAVASFYPQMKAESQCYREDGKCNTLLNGTNPGYQNAVTYAMTTGCYAQVEKEKTPTLMARDFKEPDIVNHRPEGAGEYIVRRLTPRECARLQGFPDWWCDGLAVENPTDEEIAWWQEVFAIYNKAVGKSVKPRSANQIRKWLQNPHTDSAEYRMWGNGVALPCVCFVMAGIANAVLPQQSE